MQEHDTAQHEWLTLGEALSDLNMDKSTFYRYCRRGWLTKVRHAGRTYVARQWINDYWSMLNAEGTKARTSSSKARKSKGRVA